MGFRNCLNIKSVGLGAAAEAKISKFDENTYLKFKFQDFSILAQTCIDKFHLIAQIDPLEDYSVIYLQKKIIRFIRPLVNVDDQKQ